jgi:hypothetical protein
MTLNLAYVALLLFVCGLIAFDAMALRGKNRRALWVEIAAFVTGGFFIVFPDRATALAHLVGIGRGVDFLLYPIVIWLVRESLLSRRRRLEDAERITQLTRALALAGARVEPQGSARMLAQSAGDSPSLTT